MKRIGLGKGRGSGYRNIIPRDPRVHSDAARGVKQPQLKMYRWDDGRLRQRKPFVREPSSETESSYLGGKSYERVNWHIPPFEQYKGWFFREDFADRPGIRTWSWDKKLDETYMGQRKWLRADVTKDKGVFIVSIIEGTGSQYSGFHGSYVARSNQEVTRVLKKAMDLWGGSY